MYNVETVLILPATRHKCSILSFCMNIVLVYSSPTYDVTSSKVHSWMCDSDVHGLTVQVSHNWYTALNPQCSAFSFHSQLISSDLLTEFLV